MFNRLPIYSRPKEPAIGEISRPVLQSSTNEDVINGLGSLRLQTQAVDLDGRPRNPSPALGPYSGTYDRYDDYSPSPLVKALENEPQRPAKRAPPRRPVRSEEPYWSNPKSASPQPQPTAYTPPPSHRNREERSRAPSPNTTFPHTLRSTTPPTSKKFNVSRKPAPPTDQIFDGSRGGVGLTGTTITAITGGNNNQPKMGGFANLKEKMVGRTRRPSRASPTSDSDSDYDGSNSGSKMVEIPSDGEAPISIKPPNMMLIDEWLSEREKLHKRSTMRTIAAIDNDRSGVPPGEFLPVPEPTMPLIPPSFLPRTSSRIPTSSPSFHRSPPPSMAQVEAPPPSAPPADRETSPRHKVSHRHIPRKDVTSPSHRDVPNSSAARQKESRSPPPPRKDSIRPNLRQPEPIKPSTPPPPTEPEKPKDRVQLLEEEQEALEKRKRDLKKEIYNLEQLLPPNITTHPRGTKEEMMEQMEILNRAVADVEKDLYEVGMKLHRAYRRYGKTTGSEGPTHLWISRVMAKKEASE